MGGGRKQNEKNQELGHGKGISCLFYWSIVAFPFFGIGMKTDLFQSCGHCWVFQMCWHIECSTFTASSFRIWNRSTGILSPPLALFVVMLSKAHLTSVPKNWCFWTVVLEKTLESPLDCKEIQPVHSEGEQPGISLEGMMLKLSTILVLFIFWFFLTTRHVRS